MIEVYDPGNNELVGTVPSASGEEVEHALATASEALCGEFLFCRIISSDFPVLSSGTDCYDGGTMRDLAILFIHLLTTLAKLMRPGGGRAVLAESLLLKHQLVILNRSRERAPSLRPMDRVIAGLCTIFIRPL